MKKSNPDHPLKHDLLSCAIEAASIGGGIIREGCARRHELVIQHKRPNDLVSDIDRRSEAAIVRSILRTFPGHSILAEEGSTNPLDASEGFVWIVDPLDGTTNFLHGFDHFAVSIGVQHQGVLIAAVVYDPMRDHLFTATLNEGAFLNGKSIRVSHRSGLSEALISTGLPHPSASDAPAYFSILNQVWQVCRNVRRPGAAALDLAYVAAGYLDGFFEFALRPWDIAAGALLVTEACGRISDLHGASTFLKHGYVAAGSSTVHRDLLSAVHQADVGAAWYA